MAVATTHELVLQLPANVIEMIQNTAAERQETAEQIVAEAVQVALQPEYQEALKRLSQQVRKQERQSEAEKRAHLGSTLTSKEQKRLSQLLERNRSDGLSENEQVELQRLF